MQRVHHPSHDPSESGSVGIGSDEGRLRVENEELGESASQELSYELKVLQNKELHRKSNTVAWHVLEQRHSGSKFR